MAVAIPADLDRHLGVRHRLDADVIAGTIVDLLVRPLVDVQYRDQATADGQPMRGDLPAAERTLLAHRSEERRVGTAGVSPCRYWCAPRHIKKKYNKENRQ